jgi:single-strand DNA-binding protein
MNKVELVGRLTADPTVRYTQGQESIAIASFTLAVDRRGKKQEGQQNADFIRCTAFRQTAEHIEKYWHKGMKAGISGRIQTGSYTNKNGDKVYTTDIVVEEIEFVESKQSGQQTAGNTQQADNYDGFMQIPDGIDEVLPFN